MFGKRIPNPLINDFENSLQRRGFILVEGRFDSSDIIIWDLDEFLKYAEREKIVTVFKDIDIDFVHYFYLVSGIIVRTLIKKEVKDEK